MPQVVFILGLCGAGKSTRANELSAEGFANFDEKATGRPVHPDLKIWPNSSYADLIRFAASDRDCVVTEILFYQPSAQHRVTSDLKAERPDVVIEWECFDHADLEIANYNCRNDPSRTPAGLAANLMQNQRTIECLRSAVYDLPSGTKLLRTTRRPVGA
jgi:hypothetical protein